MTKSRRHTGKRVTWTRADAVIIAIASLIECDDFQELADHDTLRELDRAADAARKIRDQRPKRSSMITTTEHKHRHSILVGNAPITMMAGSTLPIRRACACGDVITIGTYLYDPKDGQSS